MLPAKASRPQRMTSGAGAQRLGAAGMKLKQNTDCHNLFSRVRPTGGGVVRKKDTAAHSHTGNLAVP